MSRIIFVPQYPTPMRYQEWWFWKFPEEFEKAGFSVLTLGEDYALQLGAETSEPGLFSPINTAIDFETMQINEYMDLTLKDDDILFLADLSFPGFFSNVFVHKHPKRMFAYCHATSINYKDYFAPVWMYKYPIEKAHAKMFDVVFLGSDYHDQKLNWENTLVTRLPYPPLKTFKNDWEFPVVSASRVNPQKVDIELEQKVSTRLRTGIIRRTHNTWEEYYEFLSKAKVLLITSFEDTFGYQIVDAVLNGCIPLAPMRCAYPEILPREYLYRDEEELMRKLDYLLNSDHGVPYLSDAPYEVPAPKLLCDQEMKDFYKNIIEVMKGEPENERD